MPADVISALESLTEIHCQSLLEPLASQLINSAHPLTLGNTERGLIQLVDALFDQVRSDLSFPPVLLPELPNMQVAVAKAALSDPGFFDKPRHPARRLFNEATQAAQGFSDSENFSDDPL